MKKMIFLITLTLTSVFLFNIQSDASTTTFTYTNAYSNYYYIVSPTITIPDESTVFSLSIPENDYTVYEFGGIESYIVFYSNADGTGTSNIKYLNNLDDSLSVNKTYLISIDFETIFSDSNPDVNFSPKSFRILLMTNLQQAIAPSGYTSFMSSNTEYSFTSPTSVKYYDAFDLYASAYFIDRVPTPDAPTREGFNFIGWVDINGNFYTFETPPTEDQLNANGELILYSSFEEAIILPADYDPFPDFPSPTTPIATILNNTGFYNLEGMTFLYILLIIAANIALWYFKAPMFTNLIAIAVITAMFMVGNYLPLYVSIIMIGLMILLFFGMRGGLTSE